MTIALTGTHRVGKSTLAQKFAEAYDYTFIASGVAGIFKAQGVPMSSGLSSKDRLDLQDKILEAHLDAIHKARGQNWISDRSTLDFAVYTLLDAARDPGFDHVRAAAYVDRCIEVANRNYAVIVLVQPGIPYVTQEDRLPPNPAQQEAFNLMLWGLTQDMRLDARVAFIRRDVLDLDERVTTLSQLMTMLIQSEMTDREGVPVH